MSNVFYFNPEHNVREDWAKTGATDVLDGQSHPQTGDLLLIHARDLRLECSSLLSAPEGSPYAKLVSLLRGGVFLELVLFSGGEVDEEEHKGCLTSLGNTCRSYILPVRVDDRRAAPVFAGFVTAVTEGCVANASAYFDDTRIELETAFRLLLQTHLLVETDLLSGPEGCQLGAEVAKSVSKVKPTEYWKPVLGDGKKLHGLLSLLINRELRSVFSMDTPFVSQVSKALAGVESKKSLGIWLRGCFASAQTSKA